MSEMASKTLLERMPPDAVATLRTLGSVADARGVGACVVGGVVRDLLLGIPNYDLDIVVEEPAESFAAAAAAALGGTVKARTRFGTAVLVLPGGRKIDLATARSETYARPGALPDVRPDSIREDLRRRDFTINSMAVRLNADGFGTLLDPFSGLVDLRTGIIRVLTDQSFEDDPTRILRAVRFAARFGFAVAPETETLLRQSVREGALGTVSGERIMNEIVLILGEHEPWPPFERLIRWGVLPAVHPSWVVPPSTGALFAHLGSVLAERSGHAGESDAEPWAAYFLAAIEPVAAPARPRVLERLRASRRLFDLARDLGVFEERARAVLECAAEVARSRLYHALAGLATEVLLLAMALVPGAADRIALYLDHLRGVRPSLSGHDIEALGAERGPAIGEILRALLDARLDGAVGSADDERALAVRLLDEKKRS